MPEITKATADDHTLLADIGRQTFIESHGHSAPEADIAAYVEQNYSNAYLQNEVSNPDNIYHIIYHNGLPAGYSKIILNRPIPQLSSPQLTKLERIYLLQQFYELKLGTALFGFNLALSKSNNQAGMWLYVWKENPRAVGFYLSQGFKIVGSHDFKISETHANPNHLMLLQY